MIRLFLLFAVTIVFSQCNSKAEVDTLLINGTVYTIDSAFSKTESVAVKDGKIIATGTTADLQKALNDKVVIDLQGKYLYPGFINAHAHF